MNNDKPENESADPEYSRAVPSIEADRENEAKQGKFGKIAAVFCSICAWIVEFFKPANVVVILLFIATLALYCVTRDLVNDAQKTAERQLRAYVLPSEVNVTLKDATFTVGVVFKNTGQTPAYDIVASIDFDVVDESKINNAVEILCAKILEKKLHPDPDSSKGPIGPGTPFVVIHPVDLTKSDYPVAPDFIAQFPKLVEQKQRTIFAYGIVTYQDVFAQHRNKPVIWRVAKFGQGWTLASTNECNNPE